MTTRPVISGPVEDVLEEIMDEHEYSSHREAIRHALREAGYDV